jgi:hypothetical protein
VNRASVCTCCPYGNLNALPSVFGFFGASLMMTSLFVHYGFVDYPSTNMDYYPYEVCPQYSDRYRYASYVDKDGRCMVYLVGAENDPALTFAFTMSVIAASAGGCIASVFCIIRAAKRSLESLQDPWIHLYAIIGTNVSCDSCGFCIQRVCR